jgi:hypothetical protein
MNKQKFNFTYTFWSILAIVVRILFFIKTKIRLKLFDSWNIVSWSDEGPAVFINSSVNYKMVVGRGHRGCVNLFHREQYPPAMTR